MTHYDGTPGTDRTPTEYLGSNDSETRGTLGKARKLWNYVKEHRFEKEYRDQAARDLKYITGEDQGWDEHGDRARLKTAKMPALTMNRVHPVFRLICGARPKTEPRFIAVEEGDVETADILNACKDHVEDNNTWTFNEDEWFKHMLAMLRHVVEIRPNYDRNPFGDIELKLHSGRKFYLDPDSERKDRWDGEYLFMKETTTPEKAVRTFPHAKRKIGALTNYVESEERTGEFASRDSGLPDEYEDPRANYYDKAKKELTILYYWYKEHQTVTRLVDIMTGMVYDSPKPAAEARKDLDKLGPVAPERFKVITRDAVTVRYMVFCHDIVLDRGVSPWIRKDGRPTDLSDQFPFVVAEPDKLFAGTHTELISLFDMMADPQKAHNKLISAVLHIIGTTAHSGWLSEEGAMPPETEKKLEDEGGRPGIHIKVNKGALTNNRIQAIEPKRPPQTHMAMAKEMVSELMDIPGVESLVNVESLGKSSSGLAIDLKQRQGSNVIDWIYNSFRFYQHILTRFVRDAIQVLFDTERVIRIKGSKPRYVRINEQVYDERGAISQVLNDITTGQYDVVMADKQVLPSQRLERFKYFAEMVKSGALVLPPEVMVKVVMELMDDPELKRIVEEELGDYMQMMQQQQGEQPGQPGPGQPGPQLGGMAA